MAYQDDYYNRNQPYTSPPLPQHFVEPTEPAFNPYDSVQQHPTYDQGGYDNPGYGGYSDDPSGGMKEMRERSTFEGDDGIPPKPEGPYSSRKMRQWRYDHQGNLWTRGSRVRCCGRFFCCTVMIAIFLIVSIILTMALWIRPPNVLIGNPVLATTGSPISASGDTLTVNMFVNVSVNNPNYLSVNFNEIKANFFYPINNTAIGGGTEKNVDIKSNTETNFTLPVAIIYNEADDPQLKILEDLAQKCGLIPGESSSDISIQYKITLKFKVLVIPISPVISGTFNLACPLSASDLGPLLQGAGIDLSSIFSTVAREEPTLESLGINFGSILSGLKAILKL